MLVNDQGASTAQQVISSASDTTQMDPGARSPPPQSSEFCWDQVYLVHVDLVLGRADRGREGLPRES